MRSIDLNADLGEGYAFDRELMEIVSSASVACGGHAGDTDTMTKTLLDAKLAGVVTGAHPGFLDKQNFGRVQLNIAPAKLAEQVVRQVRTLCEIGKQVGQEISYVKLHGALYNWASKDEDLAKVIFKGIVEFDASLPVLALANSAQVKAAKALGMNFIAEAFADRAYDKNGKLVSREEHGSVFGAPTKALAQALMIAQEGQIIALDGSVIACDAQSICLHGDNSAALKMAQVIRTGLHSANIVIKSAI